MNHIMYIQVLINCDDFNSFYNNDLIYRFCINDFHFLYVQMISQFAINDFVFCNNDFKVMYQ